MNQNPSFDEIVLDILPLLKNGITPKNQTILSVLEDIGEHIGQECSTTIIFPARLASRINHTLIKELPHG